MNLISGQNMLQPIIQYGSARTEDLMTPVSRKPFLSVYIHFLKFV